jgi:hypothetical protein
MMLAKQPRRTNSPSTGERIRPGDRLSTIDWDWLAAQPAVKEGTYVRRLHFAEPLLVAINGKRQTGVILKPSLGQAATPAA